MLPVPRPVPGGSVEELRAFVNVADDANWRLLVAWLVAAIWPRGPYPVLILHGEQGSAKSTTARILRSLIDPNKAPLRAEPRETRDLAIAARNSRCLAFDNISHLTPALSDALCRLSTGGGFATRALYSDADEALFDSTCPVILNGIEEAATRGDLLDRALLLSLPAIPEDRRQTEAEVMAAFEAARPRILGALLDAVVGATQRLPATHLDRLPRMADFALVVTAAEEALGWSAGAFTAAYTGNREEANEVALEATPLVDAIRQATNKGVVEGSPTEVLTALTAVAAEAATSRSWPRSARTLTGQLRRLAPHLLAAGTRVEFGRTPGQGSKRWVRIRRV